MHYTESETAVHFDAKLDIPAIKAEKYVYTFPRPVVPRGADVIAVTYPSVSIHFDWKEQPPNKFAKRNADAKSRFCLDEVYIDFGVDIFSRLVSWMMKEHINWFTIRRYEGQHD